MYVSSQKRMLDQLLSGHKSEIEASLELYESCQGKTYGDIEVLFFKKPDDNTCPTEIKELISDGYRSMEGFCFSDYAKNVDYWWRQLLVTVTL